MKTIFTSLLLILDLNVFSQVKINPKLGLNLANFTQHEKIIKSTAQFGFSAGIDVRLGGRLFFTPGLYYVSSSTKLKEFEDVTINEVVTFNSFELPLALGFHIINKEALKITLKAGIEGALFTDISELERISKTDIKKLNYGFQFGAGVDIKKLTFEVRYSLGQNSLFKSNLKTINPRYNRAHLFIGYLLFKS